MIRRYCLTLDLKDDPNLIEQYKKYHEHIWPEITASLKQSGIDDAAIFGQHHAKLGVVAHRAAHHLFVSLFENMQRQRRAGKDYDLERKQREEPRRHGNIMTF